GRELRCRCAATNPGGGATDRRRIEQSPGQLRAAVVFVLCHSQKRYSVLARARRPGTLTRWSETAKVLGLTSTAGELLNRGTRSTRCQYWQGSELHHTSQLSFFPFLNNMQNDRRTGEGDKPALKMAP